MKKDVIKQKSFWSSLALIATTILPVFGVPAGSIETVQIIIAALTAIFIRQAVNK